jgi:hypothetical protein
MEFEPLLEPGIHDITKTELSNHFVTPFFSQGKRVQLDELTESASKIGKESVKKLYKFITTISNADLEVNMKWDSPSNESFEWDGNTQNLLRVAQSLTNIQMSEPEIIEFSGELITTSLRGTFEIKTDEKKNI